MGYRFSTWLTSVDIGTGSSFFLALAAFAIGYAIWQYRVISRSILELESSSGLEKGEGVFRGRQLRRRLQISALIGLCGACMFVGTLLSPAKYAGFFVLAWGLATLFIFWTILLAMVDIMSINLHFKRIGSKIKADEAKLRYELEQKCKQDIEKHKSQQ